MIGAELIDREVGDRQVVVSLCLLVGPGPPLSRFRRVLFPDRSKCGRRFFRRSIWEQNPALSFSRSSLGWFDQFAALPEVTRQARELRRRRPANLGLGHGPQVLQVGPAAPRSEWLARR